MPSLAIGDYDNDGRVDVFVGGEKNDDGVSGVLYKNSFFATNALGIIPTLYPAEVSQDSVLISWRFPLPIRLYYNLRIGTVPGGNDVLSSLSDNQGFRKTVTRGNMQQSHRFVLKNLLPSTTYYYAVQAIDEGYASSMWSPERQFTTLPSGTDEFLWDKGSLSVYPNPVQDQLTIRAELPASADMHMELLSETGQVILSKVWIAGAGINTTEIAIPAKGIYFLKITHDHDVITRKIIRF